MNYLAAAVKLARGTTPGLALQDSRCCRPRPLRPQRAHAFRHAGVADRRLDP